MKWYFCPTYISLELWTELKDFGNRWWSVNSCLENYIFIFLYLSVSFLADSRQILGKFGVIISIGLILKQQMDLIVAYIWKIENVIRFPYGKVNLDFIYVFRSSFIASNNRIALNFFYLKKINWNNFYLRIKQIKNLSQFDINKCILKCRSKVYKLLLDKIYVCWFFNKKKVKVEIYPKMALLIKTVRDNWWCICLFSLMASLVFIDFPLKF